MAERRVTINHEGKDTDAFEVPVLEATERWSEIRLEDGTIVRAKTSISSAHRLDKMWDTQGNPVYQFGLDVQIRFVESPEALRKKS